MFKIASIAYADVCFYLESNRVKKRLNIYFIVTTDTAVGDFNVRTCSIFVLCYNIITQSEQVGLPTFALKLMQTTVFIGSNTSLYLLMNARSKRCG